VPFIDLNSMGLEMNAALRADVAATPAILGVGVAAFLYLRRLDVLLLVAVNFVAAAVYSMTPFRFKERGLLGVLTAAIAQRTLPVIIAIQAMNAWDWTSQALRCARSRQAPTHERE